MDYIKFKRCSSVIAIVVFLTFAFVVITQENKPPLIEITPEGVKSAHRGIKWLIDIQNRDGSWGCEKGGAPSTAVTSLACLALMSEGSTPERGLYAENIGKGLNYILNMTGGRSGDIATIDATGLGLVFDHACATLFLSEVYGMNPQWHDIEGVKDKLKKAVDRISRTQNADGGWGGGQSDIALTAITWLALRSAYNGGFNVTASLEKVEKFVVSCADPNGGYNQYPNMGGGGSRISFYPTSAGLRIMYGLGKKNSEEVKKGSQLLLTKTFGSDYGGQVSEWDYASAFYATQALMHEGGVFWKEWYPKVREYLIKTQNQDGSWTIKYCKTCRAYATAMAILVLNTPNRLLPMLQL